jgi:hypothetical protein
VCDFDMMRVALFYYNTYIRFAPHGYRPYRK